jgi:hypothetical protein
LSLDLWNFTDRYWNLQGIGAVVGAISRNLHELQDRQGSYLSIYDHPALPLQVSVAYTQSNLLKFSWFFSLFVFSLPVANTRVFGWEAVTKLVSYYGIY